METQSVLPSSLRKFCLDFCLFQHKKEKNELFLNFFIGEKTAILAKTPKTGSLGKSKILLSTKQNYPPNIQPYFTINTALFVTIFSIQKNHNIII
jgi:hypothetical protein